MPLAGVFGAAAGDVERRTGGIDSDDRALRSDELPRQPRHVPEPSAQIEDAHAATDAGGLE